MNARALIPLIAGLGVGGLALKLGINTLQNAKAGRSSSARVKLWSPKEDIPRGSPIDAEMLTGLSFPSDAVPNGAFKDEDKEKLVGRVPRNVAPAGLPVLESMLCSPGTKPGVYPKPGFRAIAVKIDASSGVDYHIEPGCFVDVLGSFSFKKTGMNGQMTAKTVVENVEVAAVGPRTSPSSGKEEPDKNADRNVRAVTLFVTPDQAKKILLAEQQGPFKLCMRGNEDRALLEPTLDEDELAAADGVDGNVPSPALGWLRNLFQPQPAEPPAAPEPVALVAAPTVPLVEPWILKIYRGHDEETVRFKDRSSTERLDENKDGPDTLFGNGPRTATGKRGSEPREPEPAQPTPAESGEEKEAQPEERSE